MILVIKYRITNIYLSANQFVVLVNSIAAVIHNEDRQIYYSVKKN